MTARSTFSFRHHSLLLLLGTASLLAQAQTTSSTPQPTAQAGHGMHQGHHEDGEKAGHSGQMHERMHARQGKHLQELKAKLQLAPTQEAAWAGFTGALQARPSHTPPPAASQDMAQLSTPERLERMKAMRAEHQAERNAFMDRRDQATQAMYAALTPAQQKVFDAETTRMMQTQGHGHGKHGAGGKG